MSVKLPCGPVNPEVGSLGSLMEPPDVELPVSILQVPVPWVGTLAFRLVVKFPQPRF